MQRVGWIATVVVSLLLLALGAMLVQSTPDIQRYMRMRRM